MDPYISGDELYEEIKRLDKEFAPVEPISGLLGDVIDKYQQKANHWHTLRERTQKDYIRVFKYLDKIGARDEVVTHITTPDIVATRDKAAQDHEVKFANQLVTTLKFVFQFGIEYEFLNNNPAVGVSKLRGGNKRQNRPYSAEELVAIIDNAPTRILGPIYAAAIYGMREGDIVGLSKTAIKTDHFGDWLVPTTSKRTKPVWLPVTHTMQKIMDMQRNDECTTIFANSRGMPWTTDGLRSSWGTYKAKLEAKGIIEPGGTFHGFRNTVTTLLMENGYETSDIRFLVAHAPKNMTEYYAITAKRKETLIEMVECMENLIANSRGNVVRIRNKK
jgi:integrase